MSTKQEVLEERIVALEERLGTLHDQLETLPDVLNRVIQAAMSAYRLIPDGGGGFGGSLPHPASQSFEGSRHTHLHPDDAASFVRPGAGVPRT